ncbi:MAG: hypothetical protein LBC96_09295 [Lachnospiraceae bacterium]|jgi:hypothetical protein|nr:hypothetical protein [Lachnospiraceae bacterium]
MGGGAEKLGIDSNDDVNRYRIGCLIVAIYFSIFSMLFSTGILLAYVIAVLLLRLHAFLSKKGMKKRLRHYFADCIKNYHLAAFTLLTILIAMVLETTSVRSSDEQFETVYRGSLISLEFIRRVGESVGQFIARSEMMNRYVIVFMILVFSTKGVMFLLRKKNMKLNVLKQFNETKQNKNLHLTTLTCLVAMFIVFCFHVLLAAKAGPHYLYREDSSYGTFFFLLIVVCLLFLEISQQFSGVRVLLPFLLTIFALFMVNSMWPYAAHPSSNKGLELSTAIINTIVEADLNEDYEIMLYVPHDYRGDILTVRDGVTVALFNHNITSQRIKVLQLYTTTTNGDVYYLAEKQYEE